MQATQQEALNRTQRRAQGRYATAGQGGTRRRAVSALNEALRTDLGLNKTKEGR